MAIEDASVLGICLSRIASCSKAEKIKALKVYESCRRERTKAVVEAANLSQWHYHLDDGSDQVERDARMKAFGEVEDGLKTKLPCGLKAGDDPLSWRRYGIGRWLLDYDCVKAVDIHWPVDPPTPRL
jgi:salicylate hydroxylase